MDAKLTIARALSVHNAVSVVLTTLLTNVAIMVSTGAYEDFGALLPVLAITFVLYLVIRIIDNARTICDYLRGLDDKRVKDSIK
jgi:hypothetical protein